VEIGLFEQEEKVGVGLCGVLEKTYYESDKTHIYTLVHFDICVHEFVNYFLCA
jgi:hypothetical protein